MSAPEVESLGGTREAPSVLGLLGSPRARSATGMLLERVMAGAKSVGAATEVISLRTKQYRSCRHCGGCDETGGCVVQDDIQEIHARLRAASHLVLASPIQFSAVSGETKAMIDRAQAFWVAKYRLKQPVSEVKGERRGLFVATCGGEDTRVFGWARHTVKAFFSSAGFRYWDEFFETNTDKPPPLSQRDDVLARAEALGRRIVTGE